MTLMLRTRSHGDIESGFCGVDVTMSRIGSYAFSTKELVTAIREVARNPELKKITMRAVDEEVYWHMHGVFLSEAASLIFSEKNPFDGKGPIKIEVGYDSSRLDNVLTRFGKPVEFNVSESGEEIKVGEYIISDKHFGRFSHYLIGGGFFGWDRVPKFAAGGREDLEASEHPLFRALRGELQRHP